MANEIAAADALAQRLGSKLESVFISVNEMDRNAEPANVVDGLYEIARAISNLADAIRERGRNQ